MYIIIVIYVWSHNKWCNIFQTWLSPSIAQLEGLKIGKRPNFLRLDWVCTVVDVLWCLLRLAKYIVNGYSSCTWVMWILSIPCSPFMHHTYLFFLTVNRRLQYLLIEFIVQYMDLSYRGMLREEITCRPATCKKNYEL